MPFDIFHSDESTDDGHAETTTDGGSDPEPAAEVEVDDERVPELENEERYTATWESQNGAIEANASANHPVTAMLFLIGGIALYAIGTAVVATVATLAAIGLLILAKNALTAGYGRVTGDEAGEPDLEPDPDVTSVPIEEGEPETDDVDTDSESDATDD